MLWNKLIKLEKNGQHLLVEGADHYDVQCNGKSCPIIGGQKSRSFLSIPTFSSSKNTSYYDVLFVKVGNDYSFLLGIEWDKSDSLETKWFPFVKHGKNFVSFDSSCHVAISGDGLDALIDGKIYTSRTDKKGDYVVDSDTLCRYAALKITSGEVKSVAKEIEKEKSLVDNLQQKIDLLEKEMAVKSTIAKCLVDGLQREVRARESEVDEIRVKNSKMHNDLCIARANVTTRSHNRDAWKDGAEKLSAACAEHWGRKIFPIPSSIFVEIENIEGLGEVTSD